ncbi:unnamed protein product [Lepeophtheirus salmonis]|uniref:(salmon louse) hypothetical protein n=1 Tax=Lepeophtheirus salmonis TaxID=72036 RepID=A0A7R8CP42_LEPSM|nr:unnamed protein product [Lepeophtheirus salmonis]CAF2881890.1 unnamed protein product [Lepeophtheirus salmonis]
MKKPVTRHSTKLTERFCDYFPKSDSSTGFEISREFEANDGLVSGWMSKAAKAYRTGHLEATKTLLPVATIYHCKQGFSSLVNLKTKYRSRLDPEDRIQVGVTSKSLILILLCQT